MEFTCFIWVEANIELILPTEFKTGFGQSIVTNLRTRMSLRQIGCMRCDFVSDNAVFNVDFIRQTKVLFWCDIAQHGGTIPADLCCANTRRNVVVTWSNICRQWSERVERRFVTLL